MYKHQIASSTHFFRYSFWWYLCFYQIRLSETWKSQLYYNLFFYYACACAWTRIYGVFIYKHIHFLSHFSPFESIYKMKLAYGNIEYNRICEMHRYTKERCFFRITWLLFFFLLQINIYTNVNSIKLHINSS